MVLGVGAQVLLLPGRFIGKMHGSPSLAMRMRVAGAHHGPTVFEDLHVVDRVARAQVLELLRPDIHHGVDLVRGHAREREVMARREADHPANSGSARGNQDVGAIALLTRGVGQQRGEVVVEYEGGGVLRIARTAGTQVPGTEVTVGVILRARLATGLFHHPLPGPVGPVRRDKDPFAGERVQTPVRVFVQAEHATGAECFIVLETMSLTRTPAAVDVRSRQQFVADAFAPTVATMPAHLNLDLYRSCRSWSGSSNR